MSLQRFPQHLCLQARPKQTILGHEELFGPTKWGRLGASVALIQNIVHPLNMAPPVCRASSIRLPCVYYFFLAVAVVRYETTATARWALLFIVRAFINDTVTVAIWTGFHVRLVGVLPHPRNYIRWCFANPAVAAAFATEFKRTRDAVMSLNSAAQQAEAISHHRPRLCLQASVAEKLFALPPAIARRGVVIYFAPTERRISQVRQVRCPDVGLSDRTRQTGSR